MNTLFSRVYSLDSGLHTGEENMELDRRLMASFLDGRFQQRFGHNSCLWRFYSWRPYAITVGYNQDVSALDSIKCASAGIDIVRRPTGGRAVFHAEEFTYSFYTESVEHNATLYRMVHEVIQCALEGLGIHAEFCRSTLGRPQGEACSGSVSCFTASAKYELQVAGRKLVGSAQRRSRNVLLQHGSLPLSSRHKELGAFVALQDGEIYNDDTREEMERKTTSLEEILGYMPAYERLAELMQIAAGEMQGVETVVLHPDDLSEIFQDNNIFQSIKR